MRAILWLISRVVPADVRQRWREEWLAEMAHGGRGMITGAVPDAWTLRQLVRRQRRARAFHAFDQDVRYSLRGLLASPGFAFGVVLSLSLGMAAMTSAFSFLNSIALRPPAGIQQPEQVMQVQLRQRIDGLPYEAATLERYAALRDGLKSFSALAAHHAKDMVVGFPGEPITVPGMFVSGSYFEVLQVVPAAGRLIDPSDNDAPGSQVAVISHAAWLRYFAGAPSAIGSTLKVNGQLLQVVGVAPAEFTGVRREIDEDEGPRVWIPLPLAAAMLQRSDNQPPWQSAHVVQITGRLRTGVSRSEAEAETSVFATGGLPRGARPNVPIHAQLVGLGQKEASTLEWAGLIASFMAVPAIVLALACVNVANLFASRVSRRLRDAAVRLSIGATPWRLVRLLLVECSMLALGGCALGLAFTYWAAAILSRYVPVVIHIDWRVALFAATLSAATAVAFGLAPAISTARRASDLVQGMARRPETRARAVLIATQAALSLALMVTGWQFVNTVRALAQNDGLRSADRLAIASLDVSQLNWPSSEVDVYYERILDRIGQLPGVTSASYSCQCNPWGAWEARSGGSLWIWLNHHQPDKPGSTLAMYAGGDLFGALESSVVQGRAFRPDEHRGAVRSLIVNQPFADKYLRSQAVGQSVRIGAVRDFGASQPAVIVGVVLPPTARRTDALPMVYYPAPVTAMPARTMYVRFSKPAADSIDLLHAAIREVNADAPRPGILTAEQQRWERHSANQFLAAAVSLLGVLALGLAAAGLYGVVAFAVTLRSHEIAVRMALGARPNAVVAMIIREALRPAALGAALGLSGALVTGLIVRARLYGASPVDPAAFVGAASLLFAVLFAATIVPARRAAHVNPIDTLRTE
jgi:putative ABC transport system permease protein